MRIALVATSDFAETPTHPLAAALNLRAGGAGIAAMRLLDALTAAGHHCDLVVGTKLSADPRVHGVLPLPTTGAERLIERAAAAWERRMHWWLMPGRHSRIASPLRTHPLLAAAEVIHFHNLHWPDRNVGLRPLRDWAARKPVCWTLHDTWPITGHCINPLGCERWRSGCGGCPDLGLALPIRRDATAAAMRWKARTYQRAPFAVVTPSRWLAGMVQASPTMSGHPVTTIPNALDPGLLPMAQAEARRALGIPEQARTVLFAANHLPSRLKGGDLLLAALPLLQRLAPGFRLLTAGGGDLDVPPDVPIHHLGRIDDTHRKRLAFASADVLAYPTRADSLGYIVAESLAMGTPVVATAVGGVPELMRQPYAGRLVPPEDPQALAQGLAALLAAPAPDRGLVRGCVAELASATVAQRHLELYGRLLGSRR